MIQLKFLLIPYASRNVAFREETGFSSSVIGYTEHFIFGIRIAKIQKTMPWS